MTRLVLDCSVAMAWCFEDETNPYSEFVLEALEGGEALVPTLWPLEVANVLALSERKGRLTVARSTEFLALLNRLPIKVDQETTQKAFSDVIHLARAQRVTAYDAAYLELASRQGLPIATLDDKIKNAANRLAVTLVTAARSK
jgi:predicted nucleic acid-binding protein